MTNQEISKNIKILSGVVTSTFNVCTGGRFVSSSFPGLSGFFPLLFLF